MTIGGVTPGWYPDPNGQHQFRYFNGVWTDQVSDNGVVSSAPIAAGPPKKSKALLWWLGIPAAILVVLIVIGAIADATDNGTSNESTHQSFCEDFSGTWSDVVAGTISADVMITDAQNNPGEKPYQTDIDNVNQGAQSASVLAREAPSAIKSRITAISNYLNLAVKYAGGDQTVLSQLQNSPVSSEDAAALAGSVPIQNCPGQN